jgi:hypothetical protein
MSDSRLDQRLRVLARELPIPDPPPIAEAVRRRLEAERATPRSSIPLRRALALAIAALLLGSTVAYAVSEDVRDAVRELFGVGGVRIERAPDLPPAPADLRLGERIALDAAARRAGFQPLTSRAAGLRDPAGVYASEVGDGVAIAFRYPSGLVLTQFRSNLDPAFVKTVAAGSDVDRVRVGGAPGYWVADAHVLTTPGPGGRPERRLAGNTLIWQRGGLTLRLEGEIDRARGLRLARSLTWRTRAG